MMFGNGTSRGGVSRATSLPVPMVTEYRLVTPVG